MSSRVLAGFLAATIALPFFPASARADAGDSVADGASTDAPTAVVRIERPEVWRERIGLGLGSRPLVAANLPFERGLTGGAPGQEVRLSSGAKTAIIVTAIVVGVLIIVGVIAVGKPHKHL